MPTFGETPFYGWRRIFWVDCPAILSGRSEIWRRFGFRQRPGDMSPPNAGFAGAERSLSKMLTREF